jgi:hypothetical protein
MGGARKLVLGNGTMTHFDIGKHLHRLYSLLQPRPPAHPSIWAPLNAPATITFGGYCKAMQALFVPHVLQGDSARAAEEALVAMLMGHVLQILKGHHAKHKTAARLGNL